MDISTVLDPNQQNNEDIQTPIKIEERDNDDIISG